ncbi:hypothetical protein CRYUN_Cryun16bG0027800 [Craigia yunnanensis]
MGEENDSLCCLGCMDIVYGPAYICTTCDDFAIHKSCFEVPPQIQRDVFHRHPLRYTILKMIVCDGCGRLSVSILSYSCMYCVFNLDFKCASAIAFLNDENEIAKHEAQEGRLIKTTIDHFSHNHQLTCCRFSFSTTKLGIEFSENLSCSNMSKCMACKENLHDTLIYTFLPCKFVLNESCINDMPRQVQSSFHPQHILRPRAIRKGFEKCNACEEVELFLDPQRIDENSNKAEIADQIMDDKRLVHNKKVEPPEEILEYLVPGTSMEREG